MSREGGFFITLEGGEGSGKTTQINWLAEALVAEGYKVVTAREPGGTKEGEKIRELLVQRDGGNWTPMAETLLFFAARAMYVERIIAPALAEGKIVISDRFTDSTRAYQGYGLGVPMEEINHLESLVLGDLQPDLTLILDIDPKTGLERSGRRLAAEELGIDQSEDRYESLDIEFHEKLRDGFLKIAKAEKARCKVIDAMQDAQKVREAILSVTKKAMKKKLK